MTLDVSPALETAISPSPSLPSSFFGHFARIFIPAVEALLLLWVVVKHSVAAKLEDGLFPQSVFCSNVPYTIKSTSLSSKLYLKAKATPSRDPLTLTILQIVSCSKSAKGAENHGVSNKLPKGTPFVQGHAAVGILIRP